MANEEQNTGTNPEPTNNPNPEPTNQEGNNDGKGETPLKVEVDPTKFTDKFNEIKESYKEELDKKDEEIKQLKAQLAAKDGEVDDTIAKLNDEVNEKLEQAEKMKELQANVNELLHDKAEAIVDKFIQQGKIVPAQREKALNLCLSDQDMFIDLYENAPSVVDTNPKPKSKKSLGNIDKMVNYFK